MTSARSIVITLLEADDLSDEELQADVSDYIYKLRLPAQVSCKSLEDFYYDKLHLYRLTTADVHTANWGKNHAVQMYHEFGGGIIFTPKYPVGYPYSTGKGCAVYVAAWVPPQYLVNPDPPGLGY